MSTTPPGPPPGPPPRPPSGPPPPRTPPGPPPGPPRGRPPAGDGWLGLSRNQLIAIGAAVAIGAGVLVGVLLAGGGDDSEAEDVQLVSVTEPGPQPFTPPVAPEAAPPATIAAPQPPFGGTGDNTLCDREALIAFLTDPANASQARAWAGVLSISVSEIPTYVRDLVPTTLASDTRITNHTFEGGRAVGFQAVLQAGTAVLVDTFGKPVLRCRCGNPLLPPRDVSRPTYVGTRWAGFDPDVIIVIKVSQTQVFPPGGVGTIPPASPTPTTTTRPSGGGSAEEAVALVKNTLDECVRSSPDTGGFFTPEELEALLATITYRATPAAGPGLFTVKATGPEGDFATWTVDTRSDDVTAADPVAAEVGQFCPELA